MSNAQAAPVSGLLPPLAALRALLHRSAVDSVSPGELSLAIIAFEELCLRNDAALPEGMRTMRREVREAVGNYFGGASLAAVDAGMAGHPIAQPSSYWRDISASYIEYAMTVPQLSLVGPKMLGNTDSAIGARTRMRPIWR